MRSKQQKRLEKLRSLHAGEQSGVLLPTAYDENGKPLFDFELKSVMGVQAHDVDKVILRYRKELVTGTSLPYAYSWARRVWFICSCRKS